MKYSKIRNFHFKRNILIFYESGWNYKFLSSPYRKIKTIFNLEISAFFLYLLHKTNINPNNITFFGILWVYLGVLGLSYNQSTSIYLGLFIFFTKLIPDYIDGALAYLKKKQTKLGHQLDLWAGDINKIGFISGVLLYLFNSSNNVHFVYVLIYILLLNIISSKIKINSFTNIFYNKKIKSHSIYPSKTKKINRNFIIVLLKFLNYDGRSTYSDFVILLIVLNHNFNINYILFVLPWIWAVIGTLSFLKSIYSILKNK